MSHGRTLTDAQLEEMAKLRERGRTTPQIQEHFAGQGIAVSRGMIDWQCLRIGADLPAHRRRPSTQPEEPYRRGGHVVRPFSADEDSRLLDLEGKGENLNQIARQLGRRNNSIRGRLMILARRDARAEEAVS